jgi:SAM-dependent methyltransferase
MRAAVKKIYHRFIKFQPGLRYEYRVTDYKLYVDHFAGRSGIEIGGPSRIFEYFGAIPLYPHINDLDGVNFAGQTVWEGKIQQGKTFSFDERKRLGHQYIGEAADLSFIAAGKYDFLISSNCLEHLANPLKAIGEWLRVLTADGALLIVVPHRDKFFDHRRPVTRLEHLLEDEKNNTGEDDKTHLQEILDLHDLTLDPPAGTPEQFKARCGKNLENRCMHHHVFSASLLSEIFRRLDKQVLSIDILNDGNIAILVRNHGILVPDTELLTGALLKSPFKTDRDDLRNRVLGQ